MCRTPSGGGKNLSSLGLLGSSMPTMSGEGGASIKDFGSAEGDFSSAIGAESFDPPPFHDQPRVYAAVAPSVMHGFVLESISMPAADKIEKVRQQLSFTQGSVSPGRSATAGGTQGSRGQSAAVAAAAARRGSGRSSTDADGGVKLLELLGEGSFGRVYRGTWRGTEVMNR